MTEYFIVANSFAAPFVSDDSTAFQEADTPEAALEAFAAAYCHPMGLYAAEAYDSADAYHKKQPALARWLCEHEIALQEASKGKAAYSIYSRGPGDFDIDDQRIVLPNPKAGRVIAS